ncbi:MAG: 16S rRNA (uracil(1498)-N(3))-methyltransferase [Parvibaculum sp.]|nr:16S rRNA (uracil(1498)-N(3))-methyltransferase [Parvibaculum sp.]
MRNRGQTFETDTGDTPRCATGKLRLYIEDSLSPGASLTLQKERSHHLVSVLRMGEGARVYLFNGRDGEWAARLSVADEKACVLELVEQTRPQEPLADIWLLFAPVTGVPLDVIVRKASEMGAAVIQPVFTARSVVTRLRDERPQASAIEAAEQCGLLAVPDLRDAERLGVLLENWTERAPGRCILFCDETEGPGTTRAVLDRLADEGGKGAPFAVLIGPEGGFSPAEREMLRKRTDTVAMSLGPRIMRADTAATAALALVGLMLGGW